MDPECVDTKIDYKQALTPNGATFISIQYINGGGGG